MTQLPDFRALRAAPGPPSPDEQAMLTKARKSYRAGCMVGIAMVLGLLGLVVLIVLIGSRTSEDALVAGGALGALVAFCAALALLSRLTARRQMMRARRFLAFAAANGMDALLSVPGSGEPGRSSGRQTTVTYRTRWSSQGRRREAGTVTSDTGRVAASRGYLAIEIPGPMVRATFLCGMRGNLPTVGTDISLGVPFGGRRRPRLIAATADHQAVREVFTDGLIHRLTDSQDPANADLAKGWLVVHYPSGKEVGQDRWRRIFDIVEAVEVGPPSA